MVENDDGVGGQGLTDLCQTTCPLGRPIDGLEERCDAENDAEEPCHVHIYGFINGEAKKIKNRQEMEKWKVEKQERI